MDANFKPKKHVKTEKNTSFILSRSWRVWLLQRLKKVLIEAKELCLKNLCKGIENAEFNTDFKTDKTIAKKFN